MSVFIQMVIAAHPASILALRLLPIGASRHGLLAKVVHEHAVIATVGHEPPPVGAHAAEPHLGQPPRKKRHAISEAIEEALSEACD
jgi:hypothetical protein